MDVNIGVDLNKALELSRNVASAATVPGIYANLTTNASQREPGIFSNGVNTVPGVLTMSSSCTTLDLPKA